VLLSKVKIQAKITCHGNFSCLGDVMFMISPLPVASILTQPPWAWWAALLHVCKHVVL